MTNLWAQFLFTSCAAVLMALLQLAECQTQPARAQETKEEAQQPRRGRRKTASSPLKRAVVRGLQPGGDLGKELSDLDDYTVSSREDAQAICEALKSLPSKQPSKSLSSPLYHLAILFQDVEDRDAPAFEVLYKEGLPELIRIFDAEVQKADADEDKANDLLFVIKVLGMYGSREGAEKIIEAARRPLKPDDFTWHGILSVFSENHPQSDFLFESLSDPLPKDFIAVSLVDSANAAAREGRLKRHPFDSEAGWKRLQDWLENRDPDHYSYAHSATSAIPFVANPARDRLLSLAMNHVSADVQMEAAWAAAKLEQQAGLDLLVKFCKEVNHSNAAQQYLAELDREDLIPEEAKERSFAAKAEFAQWLAHPNELGESPDDLEIVDHRKLAWPPEFEKEPFWLIRYRLRDKSGLEDDKVDCGLVGSMTWCFFSYDMHERPPEDVYAIHCYWEMRNEDLIEEVDVTDPEEFVSILNQWKGGRLQSPTITHIAKASPDLKLPLRFVAVATATLEDQEGWVVLDGPRSKWYPKAEQPKDTNARTLLMIHVGRQLLGFRDQPDRKKYLAAERTPREPRQIVEAYEKIMAKAFSADSEREGGLLSRHFDTYVEALAKVGGTSKPETIVKVYDRFLKLAEQADASVRKEVYESTGLLGDHFEKYVDALVSGGRSTEVDRLIKTLAPHWQHNLGYRLLGSAAFKAGQKDVAEKYLSQLREGAEHYFRLEEMGLLAEVLRDRGESQQARGLLVDCMKKLLAEIKESKYTSDQMMFAEEFQHHRSTFLRLFPDKEGDLSGLKLPEQFE